MSLLFSPYEFSGLSLKNRVVMPPMCLYKADEKGMMNAFHFTHYGARAIGGVGLIIVEATAIEPRGRISDCDLGLWNDIHLPAHSHLTTICHQFGAKIGIQLAHAGRKSLCKHSTPVAPVPLVFSDTGGYKMPSALCRFEIDEIKAGFVDAAKRAQNAGYDMVELHAAHGYLLCEFLSPLTNTRTDKYGGSLENRCRLVLEIVEAIKNALSIPLGVRISADEWAQGGWNLEDSLYLCEILKEKGVDVIHVSAGGNQAIQTTIPALVPGYQAPYAKAIKASSTLPTIAVGLLQSYEHGENLLQTGTCDLVAYGRALLKNPNLLCFFAQELGKKELIETAYLRAF